MSLNPPTTGPSHLVARAKGLLLSPCAEWERIDEEPATVGGLFVHFVLPLAAIGPLAVVFNGFVFSHRRFGAAVHWSAISIVLSAAITYALSLVMTYVLALVIDGLAPGFCGRKNRVQAFKLAAYAGAAGWVAGVFGAVPWLGPLTAVGACYSVYLLYRGLPRLMRTPPERALGYTALTVGAALAFGVLMFVALGSVAAAVSSFEGMDDSAFGSRSGVQTLRLPGGGSVDMAQLAAAAKQAELARAQAAGGRATAPDQVKALAPARLEALLPERLADFSRDKISGETHSAAGFSASRATAVYRSGAGRIVLSLSDLAAASALASAATAFDLERSRVTPTGYEKIGVVDGRPTAEQLDRRAGRGKYAVLVADRFLVEAQGGGVTMEQLRNAASSLGYRRLEGMAQGG